MSSLCFRAIESDEIAAEKLERSVAATLGDHLRFVERSLRAAKDRQSRHRLPWTRADRQRVLELVRIDGLWRIPRCPARTVLVDWPNDVKPDQSQLGFLKNRGVPIRFFGAELVSDGLLVRTDVPLETDDEVIWCGRETKAVHHEPSAPPRAITDASGRPVELLAPPRPSDDGTHWILAIKGEEGMLPEDCVLRVDGERVRAELLPPADEGHEVVDARGNAFAVHGGCVQCESLPASRLLQGRNGVRYRWRERATEWPEGGWVQLLPPARCDGDANVDPRAAFCSGDVTQVEVIDSGGKFVRAIEVRRVDGERYRLELATLPPAETSLQLPSNRRALELQQRALRQLIYAPLPHHRGLLRLCEPTSSVSWPAIVPRDPSQVAWRFLVDTSRDGTDQQRRFVLKALDTPDFAILEGPPGSGKTTSICELIVQLVERGQRVLFCASTHVAVDNVLERLADHPGVCAVRIGYGEKVDAKIRKTLLQSRADELRNAWRKMEAFTPYDDQELERMAERTVVMSTNLTCGTTVGILRHPIFAGADKSLRSWERPIATSPHWDVLIVDEASKTLVPELLVPALVAKRWVVVGDVRQLAPFSDQSSLAENLRDLLDGGEASSKRIGSPSPRMQRGAQRACLLRFWYDRWCRNGRDVRWLIVEPVGVLQCLVAELHERPVRGKTVVQVVARPKTVAAGAKHVVHEVTVDEVRTGNPKALLLAAADLLLVPQDLFDKVVDHLPGHRLVASPEILGRDQHERTRAFLSRQAHWMESLGGGRRGLRTGVDATLESPLLDVQKEESEWLGTHDFVEEVVWRLRRLHELSLARDDRRRQSVQKDLNELLPRTVDLSGQLDALASMAFPSFLEAFQRGVGNGEGKMGNALVCGLQSTHPGDFDQRFECLTYQHRMHPELSSAPRMLFYEGRALRDANTVAIRDATLGWDFRWSERASRCAWVHVEGREQGGVNRDEIEAIRGVLEKFLAWAKRKGAPRRSRPDVWEVACLTFYERQERAIAEMLRRLTGDDRVTRFRASATPVEIVCATVDRFQGREADLVLLSMRNTARVGFLDCPNRLNVAVTRAREMLVIVGNHKFFVRCEPEGLRELARRVRPVAPSDGA